MKRFIFGLLLGIIVGAGGYWYFTGGRKQPLVQKVETSVVNGATQVMDAVQAKLEALNLRSDDIKEEMSRTGKVVRRKARDLGTSVADATADARTTAAIKAKLVADHDLSALSISVNTTAGRVTLSGTVSSPEHIGKAILLAMETDGVRDVFSTLQIK
jgi:hyperosmotically inducible periplasmic protein